jgi:hypothetical protein
MVKGKREKGVKEAEEGDKIADDGMAYLHAKGLSKRGKDSKQRLGLPAYACSVYCC